MLPLICIYMYISCLEFQVQKLQAKALFPK
uniref:Uncharacterized protein n=1 Tax=Arundo donax TaxID=35708 RepID=A0A0A9C9X0_ARUDO